MFFKTRPRVGDYRIAEKFNASSNTYVFEVQKYDVILARESEWHDWKTKEVCSSMQRAVEWVNRYRKEDNIKYHYCQ